METLRKAFLALACKAHHWHHATKSYAQHVTFGDLYDWAHSTLDPIIEGMCCEVKNGPMTVELTDPSKAVKELKAFSESLNTARGKYKWLDARIDTAQEDLAVYIYKLENLK